ncbi:hypothetical protein Glove_84g161 [Diversispora epigaea]|uniref:Protein kinase domain-containing protein n=1 Tax=Diversispora epigaea TaxID=1348612 RepID=A0A397JE90_9GLOM|nr:hypothetical protein Glove_84g161 [Diversispora epigaea]
MTTIEQLLTKAEGKLEIAEKELKELNEKLNESEDKGDKRSLDDVERMLWENQRKSLIEEKKKLEKKEKKWEEQVIKLQDALVVNFNKEKDDEENKGWDRLIEEKKKWEEQLIKLQDALVVDFNKQKEQKRKAKKHPDGIERGGKRISTEDIDFPFLNIGRKQVPRNFPIVLYHPVFANFVNDCETIDLESDSHIMVTEFTHAMSATYSNRLYRRNQFRELVNKYLGFILNLGVISTNIGDYPTDGCIFQGNCVPVILVVNNDEAGNTFREACTYYSKWIQSLECNYMSKTRLPCLLLCLTASHLRIAGAFYGGNYGGHLIESLAEISLDQFESTEPKRTQIIGRILLALKKAVQSLKEYYDSPNQTIPLEFPYVTSFKLLDSECEIQFKYEKRLLFNFIFVVKKMANGFSSVPEFLIVKFVTRYGLEMHQICANKGIAPKIYGYEKINCDWNMVIMEYLSDYKSLGQIPNPLEPSEPPLKMDQKMRLQEKINDVVKEMHSEGFVHGDLREDNILYKKEEKKSGEVNIHVKIIGFVLGGKENATNYPSYLDPNLSWPFGVGINKPIKKIHDEKLLQSTMERYLKM